MVWSGEGRGFLADEASGGEWVPTNGIVVRVLWHVEIGHADQVTAVLRGVKDGVGER